MNMMKSKFFGILMSLVLILGITAYATEKPAEGYVDITTMEAQEMIETMPELVIIDVSPMYGKGHIPGAVNYPVGDGSLDAAIPTLDKSLTYLVYCHSDEASIAGATKLFEAGFENIYRLEGNFAAWVEAGYPVE